MTLATTTGVLFFQSVSVLPTPERTWSSTPKPRICCSPWKTFFTALVAFPFMRVFCFFWYPSTPHVIAIYGRVATTGLFIATYESSRVVASPARHTLLRPPLHRFSWTNLRRGWYTIFGESLAIFRVLRVLLFQSALIAFTAQRKYSRSFYVDFGFAPLNWVKNRKKLFGNPNSRILGFHFLECKTNALFEIRIR